MKTIVSVVFFFCLPLLSIAQQRISGTVVNGATDAPLSGASVFINNASNGTTTDAEGHFNLTGIAASNFDLVVSFVNFKTVVVKISLENINKRFKVQMEPKPQELEEVVVAPILKDGWQIWGKRFADLFIGTSKNASECVIKNPQVLRFRFDKKNRILKVTASDQLKIENKALGLNIDYQLEEFQYDAKAQAISFYGYSSFSKMLSRRTRKQQKWINSRRDAYNGSLMHFMRSVYNNDLEHEGFEIRQLIRLYKSDSIAKPYYDSILNGFNTVFDTSHFSIQLMRSAVFSPDPIIYLIVKRPLATAAIRKFDSTGKSIYLYFRDNLMVVYKNGYEKEEYARQTGLYKKGQSRNQQSVLDLPNDRAVLIEKDGSYFDPLDLFTEEYMGWEKMAEMLPIDYQPGD